VDAGARFLAAFNEIEDHFRKVLGADEHAEFQRMAQSYAASRHLPREQRDALSAFASLRNAISHGRYYGGRPIAEPVDAVVGQIERLRDRILTPPRALSVLGTTEVRSADVAEPVSAMLQHVQGLDYSQFPVYDKGAYVGLLTTNTIARWLAAQLSSSGGLAEVEPVGRVLAFAEPHEQARHVPRTITAADAVYQLSSGGRARRSSALIITERGQSSEKPLALVVDDDLPALLKALEIS
jgi:hypothetical protein